MSLIVFQREFEKKKNFWKSATNLNSSRSWLYYEPDLNCYRCNQPSTIFAINRVLIMTNGGSQQWSMTNDAISQVKDFANDKM
jgi:hypothetical protein